MRSTSSEYRRKNLPSPILREFLDRQDYTKTPEVKIPPAERCLPFLPTTGNFVNQTLQQQSSIIPKEKPCCQSCSDGGLCAGN